ncbi:dGTP triphosphohydrolase [Fusobacterium ulcerans]|uniref:dGTP triphosphohydrolase n=1 Tax=Fusobacterium ulcerans TaxID=861 RepID=UPI0027B8D7CA|nr:dNTP triphosphohydrolase [Fusobacterium ulcerans]
MSNFNTWKKLLSEKRESNSTTKDTYRNGFDKDYDRIISASSIRRLQDKAQVFPLQENDFTRTRLTHSLEVSAIARSMGLNVEARIFEDCPELKGKLPSLLAVTGLLHDLGNPPYGHFGEDVIKMFFNKKFEKSDGIKMKKYQDFEFFDGNAQTIRILTKLQELSPEKKGMNMTYATLATLIKYPFKSGDKEAENKKKIGFYETEKENYKDIIKELGLKDKQRHPVTYLLEAADDIAYLFADIEDGFKKNVLSFEIIKKNLIKGIDEQIKSAQLKENIKKEEKLKRLMENIENVEIKGENSKELELSYIKYYKIYIQGYLIETVCEYFIENFKSLLNNQEIDEEIFKIKCLLGEASFSDKIEGSLRKICKEYIYNCSEVLKLELVGERVLTFLLNTFTEAIDKMIEKYFENEKLDEKEFEKIFEGGRNKESKLYKLISLNLRMCQELKECNSKDEMKYKGYQLIIDYISGMTDSYALKLHRELSGIEIQV